MKKMMWFYPVFALLGFAIWWFFSSNKPIQFGAQAMPETPAVWIIVYGYVVTLGAVWIGTAYRELQQRKQNGEKQINDIGAFLKSTFRSIDFWLGLLGSPLVYALLWKSLEGGSVAALTIVALQNGFCCTVIISNLMAKTQAPTGSNQSPSTGS